jgi:hypothetical protein
MLEILAIIYLYRTNGRIAEKKGYEPGKYKAFSFLLWIGGEIAGAIFGGILSAILGYGDEGRGLIYLFGLAGALAGAGLSRWLVTRLPSIALQTEVFD